MAEEFALKQVTPFVPVADLGRSIRFYEQTLGFRCTFRADNYAYIRRGTVALRLLECPAEVAEAAKNQQCYIDVDGIDALFDSLRAPLSALPSGRVRPPFDQDYGQREFHVLDEDGFLLMFGETLST